MANDFVARRHVKSAGIFAEWYLKPGTSAKQENFATSIWRQIFQQPLIPYSVNDRRATLQHAYDELHDEVAAWEATLDEERRLKASRQERLPVGSYPSFTHANQVKTYLRQNGVTRRVIARKVIVPPVADSPPGFAVYVDYTRAE